MKQVIKLFCILSVALTLASCSWMTNSRKNEYGIPQGQWNNLTPEQQAAVRSTSSYRPAPSGMTHNEKNYEVELHSAVRQTAEHAPEEQEITEEQQSL